MVYNMFMYATKIVVDSFKLFKWNNSYLLLQLLKFVPTSEETQMLMEYSKEIDSMARADRFLYEASRYHNTRA